MVQTTTAFTTAELNGDFSNASNPGPDPNVAAFLLANPYFQPNATLAAQAIIDPAEDRSRRRGLHQTRARALNRQSQ